MSGERESNFECMRIASMLMIIGHHLAIHGVQHVLEKDAAYLIWSDGLALNKAFTCLLLPGGQIGVALFFMITGYFQINKEKANFSKIILEPFFYGIMMSLVYAVLLLGGASVEGISLSAGSLISMLIRSVFNPASGEYGWFVTAYFFLMLISPLLNSFVKKLNKDGMLLLIALFWGIWYSIPYLTSNSYLNMHKAIFFYLIGAFCHRFKSGRAVNRTCLLGVANIGWLVAYVFFLYHVRALWGKRILLRE